MQPFKNAFALLLFAAFVLTAQAPKGGGERHPYVLPTANKTFVYSMNIFDPVAGDSGRVLWQEGKAITITRVACNSKGGTDVVINLYQRTEADPETGGTKVMTADLTCTTGAMIATTTFNDATVPARTPLALTITSVSGVSTDLRVFVEFTVD